MSRGRISLWLVIGWLSGLTASFLLYQAQPANRLVVGGTGQALSALLLMRTTTILIGGGSLPHDSADLADRSTVPWQRPYTAAIVPGWDTTHLPGILSLIERRGIRSILIVGQPSGDPAWTILQRQAAATRISLSFVTEPTRLVVDSQTLLELYPFPDASVVCLEYGLIHIAFVDARPSAKSWSWCGPGILTVALRQPPPLNTPVLVRPKPRQARDIAPRAPYDIHLDRGERLTFRLSPTTLRLPREAVLIAGTPTGPSP